MRILKRLAVVPASLFVLAACQSTEQSDIATQPTDKPSFVVASTAPAAGVADVEEFEVCKRGSSGTFSYTVDLRSNGAGVDQSGTFSLNDGDCRVVALQGGLGADVSVTETGSQTGFHLDHANVTTVTAADCQNPSYNTTTQSGPTVNGTISGSQGDGTCDGTLVEFFNTADEQEEVGGRMTGGGRQIDLVSGLSITRGFTIHCDIVLSNNLEINWAGNQWHLDKPLTKATCIDDPAISPTPPAAPFDTFIGEGIGRLNGVDGSKVKFTFVDAGEPGRNDLAGIQIWDPNGNLVLNLPLSKLDKGNIQAHYDQPHGQKP